ncbi:CdaR family protein [Desulfofundulus thermocisternus]|uniref:CdaR family protein n=1 Tax=Desulfofundulus thermocisternus TaxID=42471 RepID=UPI000480DBCF|nr:CdaR family protein [Desulfofundulus thermocisternus]
MPRLNWRNFSLQILSLLMALILWVYVTNEQNPVEERTFNVPLQGRGIPEGFQVTGLPSTVSVQVQGSRSQLVTLTPGDFQAAVDLSGIARGENEPAVTVNAPPGIRVLRVLPPRVRVHADRIVEKEVPVEVTFKGQPAAGYSVQAATVDPPLVHLKGPERLVKTIGRVTASVNVQGASGAVERSVTLTGLPGEVSAFPPVVKVVVPILALPAREVPVEPRVRGTPAEGYRVEEVLVEPGSVQVLAPAPVLEGVQRVSTAPLDINGASQDVVRRVSLVAPGSGIILRPREVQVTVRLSPLPENPPVSTEPEEQKQD